MQIRIFASGLLLGAAVTLLGGYAMPQDVEPPSEADMEAMMQEWQALMTPGEAHKRLEPLVGDWTTTTRMYMAGPGSEPMVSEGEAHAHWILDGRFLLQEVKSEMRGVPYTGYGVSGYDSIRNTYVGTWIDSTSNWILTMKGTVDQSGKVFTAYGEMDEPDLGVYGRLVKYVTRIESEDKHVFEVYDLHVGDDYLVFDITYERVK